MEESNQVEVVRMFANVFAASLAEQLTLRLEESWDIKTLNEPGPAKSFDKTIAFRLTAAGGLQGSCFVTFEESQVTAINKKSLAQSASDTHDQQGNALDKILAAVMEGLSSALLARYGVVTFQAERATDLQPENLVIAALAGSVGDEAVSPILLRFDDMLLASLTSPNVSEHPAQAEMAAIEPANLQLVMDVELNVSLRFGQCQLPLRDVLDLNSGSVIELDRDVDDPVELLLDGKVIARGEAVIVDGNYGLRITEIPQPIASHFSGRSFKGESR